MRIIIRIAVLALAGYGAWKLYDEYGNRLPGVRSSFDEFSARTKRATGRAADQVGSAADDATDAITDAVADIRDAATDAGASAQRSLRDTHDAPQRSSS